MSPGFLAPTKLIIFDVDGVIYDIIDAIRDSTREQLEKHQLKVNFQSAMEDVSHVLEIAQAMPIPQLILNGKEVLDVPLFTGMSVLMRLRIAGSIYTGFRVRKEKCGLFPGIKELIAELHSRGYKLAILSNNKRNYVLDALEKTDLQKYFKTILGFNEVSKNKPDPEGILKILEIEHVTPEQTLFIGDMPSDILAGKRAGIRTIAVASGLSTREKLENEKPTQIVSDIPTLSQLLLN
jgi:HAD superfamily hydrolase (TIGR01662 family)